MRFSDKANILWTQQFQQLSVMIDAGLTIENSLKTLKGSFKEVDKGLFQVIRFVQRGISLSDALFKASIINDIDHATLSIAEKAGKLPRGLIRIEAGVI